jgi:tripartite-type tricarboxylate transporter receptor subunit TctC
MRKSYLVVFAALAVVAAAHGAQSTGYPDRPIRFVLGSAAGSGPDIIARVLSERLS